MTSKETDARPVSIECPVCGKRCPNAQVRDFRQMLLLFYIVPVFYHTPTIVECSCGASLVSRLKARDLEGLDSQFATRYLSVRISPVLKTLVLGGVVAWLLPVIGTVWLGIAYWWSRRYSGWIRSMALALFVLSLLPTSVIVFDTLATKMRASEPNQTPQRNAGSRPSSNDSSASETPSSLAPRG